MGHVMMTKKAILRIIQDHREEISEKYGVKKIGLFGSYVRDEAGHKSDIDILVEFNTPNFDNYMELKFYLEDLLKATVDLVLADTLKPRIRPYISKEVVYA